MGVVSPHSSVPRTGVDLFLIADPALCEPAKEPEAFMAVNSLAAQVKDRTSGAAQKIINTASEHWGLRLQALAGRTPRVQAVSGNEFVKPSPHPRREASESVGCAA